MIKQKRYPEALTYFRIAAEGCHPQALSMMGVFYEQELGCVKRDMDEAVSWFRKAAKVGSADAQKRLEELGYAS